MKHEDALLRVALSYYYHHGEFQITDLMADYNSRTGRGLDEANFRTLFNKLVKAGFFVEKGIGFRQNRTCGERAYGERAYDKGGWAHRRGRTDKRTKRFAVVGPQELIKVRKRLSNKPRKARCKPLEVTLEWDEPRPWERRRFYNSTGERRIAVFVEGVYAGELSYKRHYIYESRAYNPRMYRFIGDGDYKGVDTRFKNVEGALTALRRGKYRKPAE